MGEDIKKTMDIFQQIRNRADLYLDRTRQQILEMRERKNRRVEFQEYIEKLKMDANETERLLKDPRYVRSQHYLTETRKNIMNNLEIIGTKSIHKDEYLLQSVRFWAQIELLDNLINRATNVLDEWQRVTKQLNKEE